jgi:hypothetical protein
MNHVKEVNVFGVGRVSRRAVAEAAQRHPDVGFRFFSRQPRRYPPYHLANVRFLSLDHLNNDGTPLVLCMASDEGRIIQELQQRGTGIVPRSAVATANLRLLRQVIDPVLWGNRLVVVVTNPVELICEFLVRATGNPRVYGFGMMSDRQRVEEALRRGFRLSRDEASGIEVTGLHYLRPIPMLSHARRLVAKLESLSAEEVARNLAKDHSRGGPAASIAGHFARGLGALSPRPPAHSLLLAVVNAITASEFRGSGPPVQRGSANLAQFLSAVINHGQLAVSGRCHALGSCFLGGTLDLRSGEFRVPALGACDRELLDDDLAEHHRFRRQHLE